MDTPEAAPPRAMRYGSFGDYGSGRRTATGIRATSSTPERVGSIQSTKGRTMVKAVVRYGPPEDPDTLQAGLGSDQGQAAVNDIPNFATGGVTIFLAEID
jgi:hypothetical protein